MDKGPAMVLETGTVRAWQDMDKLEQVALLTKNGFGSNAFRSGGHKLIHGVHFVEDCCCRHLMSLLPHHSHL